MQYNAIGINSLTIIFCWIFRHLWFNGIVLDTIVLITSLHLNIQNVFFNDRPKINKNTKITNNQRMKIQEMFKITKIFKILFWDHW